jgi:PAS domain S-box-containing protein
MTQIRILVVEDETIVAESIQQKLGNLGYEVVAALASGEEAVAQATALQPDLVLMDIGLAGALDGVEAAEQIHRRCDVPVVYLTAHADSAVLQRAKVSEPFGYLLKPFREDVLHSTIEMALYKHAMEQKLRESEARYRLVSELVSDFAYFFRVEPDGTLVPEWLTEAFSRITGFDPEEVTTRDDWLRLIHPDDRSRFSRGLRTVLSGQSGEMEFRIITKGGAEHWLQVYGHPMWDDTHKRVTHFYGAARDISERKRGELAIQRAAAAAERERLAHDLHDAVTQTLFSASLIAEVLPQLWALDPGEGRRNLDKLRQLTRGALAEMRTLLLELRPAALTERPLDDLLRHLSEAFTSRTNIPIEFAVNRTCSLPPDVQIALYRIAQEALNNIAKHATASRASVNLACSNERVELCISDDGCGFDPGAILPGHLGLGIMRERAEKVGIPLTVESEIGRGTRVKVVWQNNGGKRNL